MRVRHLVLAIVLLATFLVPLSPRRAQAALVISDNFPDPWVLLEGGTYYAYSTNHGQPDCWMANVPVRTSTDLTNWNCDPGNNDVMPVVPAWATAGTIWAPTIGRLNNGTHGLWFASRRKSDGGWCVGAAFSNGGPRGPFVAESGPKICQDHLGGTIDPAFFKDQDGAQYLLYKSEGVVGSTPQQTWIRRLTDDGRSFAGPEVKLLETTEAWEGNVTENPSMIFSGGSYWLFYSGNEWYTSHYALDYAVCDSVYGPCHKSPGGPFIGSSPGALGPGGPALFKDKTGGVQLAYQAWTTTPCSAPECGNRSLFIKPLRLVGDTASFGCPGQGSASSPAPPSGSGYWMLEQSGVVHAFGAAGDHGDAGVVGKAVDIEPTHDEAGYWVLDSAGCVHRRGGAQHFGHVDPAVLEVGEGPASISGTPTGNGYWVFTDRGRAITFGDAAHFGDASALPLNGPMLDSVATPSGNGYYLIASDGGVFAYGDAKFDGSMGGVPLNQPVNGLAPDPDGGGYWLVASDGGIFAFKADFRGSMGGTALNKPVVGAIAYADGYLLVGSDGGIFNFSSAAFHGSLGGSPPPTPVVSVAAVG